MSATIRPKFLETLDRKNAKLRRPECIDLKKHDQNHEILQAFRPMQAMEASGLARKTRKNESTEKLSAFVQALAEAVTGEHHEASLSLVVCRHRHRRATGIRSYQRTLTSVPLTLFF